MLITQSFSWPEALWPDTVTPATHYAVFQVYPAVTPLTPLQVVASQTATLSFDDTASLLFQVRPCSADGTQFGPEIVTIPINTVPCRAWLRHKVRFALADQATEASASINWSDGEINGYIDEAINELSTLFPRDASITIAAGSSSIPSYPLPDDCYLVRSVEYVTEQAHIFLTEKPYRGGETTPSSYVGYPKLGVMLAPMHGRLYAGHYEIYEKRLNLDWQPRGADDTLIVRYAARHTVPRDDAELLTLQPDDMELISLRTQMKCWLRVESQDVRLSRWKTEGGRRDDMPTQKMSYLIKNLYDQIVNDRRETRPRVRRLVRR